MTEQPRPERIDWNNMMQPLLVACPSFRPVWMEFLTEWEDNPILHEEEPQGKLPLYLALSDLANHLIEKLERGETETFPAVFEVVESWHLLGTHEVQEAATIGLLEDLTSEGRYATMGPEDFAPWLGPETRRWWEEIKSFWERLEREKREEQRRPLLKRFFQALRR
ncbi:MAG: hypothetical protein H0T82_04825 [Sphingomonas sp.]|nr:hypothetical protein [Sphingomonas sp.]